MNNVFYFLYCSSVLSGDLQHPSQCHLECDESRRQTLFFPPVTYLTHAHITIIFVLLIGGGSHSNQQRLSKISRFTPVFLTSTTYEWARCPTLVHTHPVGSVVQLGGNQKRKTVMKAKVPCTREDVQPYPLSGQLFSLG